MKKLFTRQNLQLLNLSLQLALLFEKLFYN
jgi:hypothetical protein